MHLIKLTAATDFKSQRYMLDAVIDVLKSDYKFNSFEEVNPYFKKLINQFKQMNYSVFLKAMSFMHNEKELEVIIQERKVA
jgi:V/A-type H+/Na+-transporting ATPase subunit A